MCPYACVCATIAVQMRLRDSSLFTRHCSWCLASGPCHDPWHCHWLISRAHCALASTLSLLLPPTPRLPFCIFFSPSLYTLAHIVYMSIRTTQFLLSNSSTIFVVFFFKLFKWLRIIYVCIYSVCLFKISQVFLWQVFLWQVLLWLFQ